MPRGRPANILRPVKLTTFLPEDLRARLDLYLYSEVEQRVPHGAYAQFLAERVREFFEPKPTACLHECQICKNERDVTRILQGK